MSTMDAEKKKQKKGKFSNSFSIVSCEKRGECMDCVGGRGVLREKFEGLSAESMSWPKFLTPTLS